MTQKKKVLLKKKTATVTTGKKAGETKRVRLMSIGFGAKKDLISRIDTAARKKKLTRASFMKQAVERAVSATR